MRINTNIPSLNAQRQMSQTTRALARSLARLSSGQRVNSARDDAAGLAIGEGLNSQVRGLTQVALNINQAFGYLNTADGILSTQTELVQRMKELAVQGANGVLSNSDRKMLETELLSLVAEFDRVSEQANFNGTNLLDGSLQDLSLQVGLHKGESINFSLEDSRGSAIFTTVSTVGTGSFSLTQSFYEADGPYLFGDIGDADNDGDNDFVVVSENDNVSHLYRNQGDGTYSDQELGYNVIEISDLNGDGLADYVEAVNLNTRQIYLQQTDGSFSLSQSLSTRVQSMADFDADGDLDLVGQNNAGVLSVHLNDGQGFFGGITSTSHPILMIPQFADINGDEILDAYQIDGVNHRVTYMLGIAGGAFAAVQTLDVGVNYSTIRFADFNGDGIKDVVAAHASDGSAVVRMGASNGTFTTGQTITSAANYSVLWETQDINNDGFDDLFLMHDATDSVAIRLSDGSGSFSVAQTVALPSGYGSASFIGADHFADLDSDGHIDMLSSSIGGLHTILWGDGRGAFSGAITIADDGTGYAFVPRDLNNDGILDLVGDLDPYTLSGTPAAYFTNNGDRTFSYASVQENNYFSGVILKDYNGDGVNDYLISQPSNTFDNLFGIFTQGIEVSESALKIQMESQEDAQNLLDVFDRALQKLSERRAVIGATTARLESALTGTSIALENLSAARSQTMDLDIASETAELTRLQILQQAQISVLQQANTSLQIVLSLLKT